MAIAPYPQPDVDQLARRNLREAAEEEVGTEIEVAVREHASVGVEVEAQVREDDAESSGGVMPPSDRL